MPIECAQGDQPVRCPNRVFCVHQPSVVPSGGGVLVVAGCVSVVCNVRWCGTWCHVVGCEVRWSNVAGCEVTWVGHGSETAEPQQDSKPKGLPMSLRTGGRLSTFEPPKSKEMDGWGWKLWPWFGWRGEVMWLVARCHVMWCGVLSCHLMWWEFLWGVMSRAGTWCHVMCSHVMRCHLMWSDATQWDGMIWACDAIWLVVRSCCVIRRGCVMSWIGSWCALTTQSECQSTTALYFKVLFPTTKYYSILQSATPY